VFLTSTCTPFASHLISADGDFALHVAHGRLMLGGGGLLAEESTSVLTAGKPFVAHEWLAQAILGVAHGALGLAGAQALMAALLASVFVLAFVLIRRAGGGPWPAMLLVLGAIVVARVHMLARPHLFTWALALVWTWRLERLRLGELGFRRWLAGSIVLTILWTNLHGGFLVAYYLLGLYGLGALGSAVFARDAARGRASLRFGQLFMSGGLLLAVSGINPFGFGLHAHLGGFLATPALHFPREFQPPDLTLPATWPLIAWAISGALLLAVGRKAPITWWLLFAGLLLVTARSARHAPLFALLTAPMLGARAEALLRARSEAGGRISAAILASSERLAGLQRGLGGALSGGLVAAGLTLSAAFAGVPSISFDPQRLPVEAAHWIAQHPGESPGPVWAPYRWAGYAAYVLSDQRRTFANSFADHWSPEHAATFTIVREAHPGWDEVLKDHGVRLAVEEPGSALFAALSENSGWRQVHSDPQAVVFARRD
jgi:hypothetical protein